MCITFFKLSPSSPLKFILGFNREVELTKPTREAAFWEGDENIVGGRDLVQGGACLALNVFTGHIAILTNYAELPFSEKMQFNKKSRGDLVRNWVSSEKPTVTPKEYLQQIISRKADYNPFNLIVGSLKDIDQPFYVIDYTMDEPQQIPFNIYQGMSNSAFQQPYPKVSWGLSQLRSTNPSELPDAVTAVKSVLRCETHHPFHEGYDPEDSIFVRPFSVNGLPIIVGTISTTVITLDDDGKIRLTEWMNYFPEIESSRAEVSHQIDAKSKFKTVNTIDCWIHCSDD